MSDVSEDSITITFPDGETFKFPPTVEGHGAWLKVRSFIDEDYQWRMNRPKRPRPDDLFAPIEETHTGAEVATTVNGSPLQDEDVGRPSPALILSRSDGRRRPLNLPQLGQRKVDQIVTAFDQPGQTLLHSEIASRMSIQGVETSQKDVYDKARKYPSLFKWKQGELTITDEGWELKQAVEQAWHALGHG